jgi:hypothetical protein
VTAETKRHNREPNNGRGDGQGFNADPFPHPKRLAPIPQRRGLYVGIFRYKPAAASKIEKLRAEAPHTDTDV